MWTKATDYPVIDNNYTVANLLELSEYEFRVIAVNAAGKSEPSLESAPIKIKEKVGRLCWVLSCLYPFKFEACCPGHTHKLSGQSVGCTF